MKTASLHLLLPASPHLTLPEAQESLLLAALVLRAQPPDQVSWLLEGIAKEPRLCEGLRQRVEIVLQNSTAMRLFVETGLPSEQGFLINTIDVMSKNLLPVAARKHDLGDFLAQLFPDESDAKWLESLSPATCEQLIELLSEQGEDRRGTWRKIRSELCDAVEVLALKVASLGLAENIHSHAGSEKIQDSPFHKLLGVCQGLLVTLRTASAEHDLRLDHCVQEAVQCRSTLSRVIAALEQKNISSLAGNVSLGFMLAMIPVLGKFTGIPLDVRHVTLSAGALAFASARLGLEVLYTPLFWKAVLGIVFIGMLNLTVSFLLALVVAFRAREARFFTMWHLLREVLREAGRRPLSFVWPVKEHVNL